MPSPIRIQLARTRAEFEAAYRLLQQSRELWGLERPEADKLWLLKQHALPSTNTIVAIEEGEVVGAICVFGDSPFHLPLEERLNLKDFRENLEGRVAELSLPALHPRYAESGDLLHALYHFAVCFGASYCHYEGFVNEAPLPWVKAFAGTLGLHKIFEPVAGRQLLFLKAREAKDFRAALGPDFKPEFRFPEKKFFLVAHQNIPADALHYLFNERTGLFASLNDFDLRVLKNIYDYGEYAHVLPDRSLKIPAKKTPRQPRFPMNCEGFYLNPHGAHEHVQVLDVSREGLKIRLPETENSGLCYVLTLFVGVNRKAELIASTVWTDEVAGIAGLEIKSADQNWTQLIEYLEKDFLRVA